jgi:hypothetical protein
MTFRRSSKSFQKPLRELVRRRRGGAASPTESIPKRLPLTSMSRSPVVSPSPNRGSGLRIPSRVLASLDDTLDDVPHEQTLELDAEEPASLSPSRAPAMSTTRATYATHAEAAAAATAQAAAAIARVSMINAAGQPTNPHKAEAAGSTAGDPANPPSTVATQHAVQGRSQKKKAGTDELNNLEAQVRNSRDESTIWGAVRAGDLNKVLVHFHFVNPPCVCPMFHCIPTISVFVSRSLHQVRTIVRQQPDQVWARGPVGELPIHSAFLYNTDAHFEIAKVFDIQLSRMYHRCGFLFLSYMQILSLDFIFMCPVVSVSDRRGT